MSSGLQYSIINGPLRANTRWPDERNTTNGLWTDTSLIGNLVSVQLLTA
ncbi:MAG: hypothetical protein WD578_09185 [Bacteroidales bacterium]